MDRIHQGMAGANTPRLTRAVGIVGSFYVYMGFDLIGPISSIG